MRSPLGQTRRPVALRSRCNIAFVQLLLIAVLFSSLFAGRVFAQVDNRPSNDRPSLPPFESEERVPIELPDIQPSRKGAGLSEGLSIVVEEFDFTGNSAFTADELRAAIDGFKNRRIESEDLLAARDQITRLYIDAGYATSGAVIPDQSVADGRLLIQIIEGGLEHIEVQGAKRFRDSYFKGRLAALGRAPLNVNDLEQALQRFQSDNLVERMTARLEPTSVLGRSRLILIVAEARQEDLRIGADNDRSPSVGDQQGFVNASAANLAGVRDELNVRTWISKGIRDVDARYALPVTRWDTTLEVDVRWTESRVIEFPFHDLDIESESLSVSLGIEQPVYRTGNHLVSLGLRGEWRKGKSTLDGRLFCFQPGVLDCTPSTAVVRLNANWQWQGEEAVLAARSTVSWGTGWLGATTRPGNVPDGRFVSWLAQLQYARRLPLSSRLIARFDTQLTDDPLLAFEQMAIGGARTVRGYRANQVVRDNGVIGSLEWRLPIWRRPFGSPYVEIAPFWDIGYGWNETSTSRAETISGLGLGLLMRPFERVEAEIYWGGRLMDVDRHGSGLIGEGVHFRVVVDAW